MIDTYRSLPPGARLGWTFRGTIHALRYGPRPRSEVEPLLRVFELLERPVSADELSSLRTLVRSRPLPRRNAVATRLRHNHPQEVMPIPEDSHATR
jgi:hypothetical protein